jgi:[acyl-carrier-protein] S-malonyltransferase
MTIDHTLGFVFPGQGSQTVGMLQALASQYPLIEQTFEQASTCLGYDLWALIQQGPAEQLQQTVVTQPALLAASVSIWRVWVQHMAVRPAWLAGHSLGEYSALVCAKALAFTDAIQLVAERGRLMQAAVPAGTGAMAALLGLTEAEVQKVCDIAAEQHIVTLANDNAPGQIVIAGELAAVERAIVVARKLGAKRAIILPVSIASHCPLMQPAATQLAQYLQDVQFTQPTIPILHNADVQTHQSPDAIKKILAQQLFMPVRWVDTIQALAKLGIQVVVECGPGKVLSGLTKRIDPKLQPLPLDTPSFLASAMQKIAG